MVSYTLTVCKYQISSWHRECQKVPDLDMQILLTRKFEVYSLGLVSLGPTTHPCLRDLLQDADTLETVVLDLSSRQFKFPLD